ncbi:amine sulfotransferase-like [Dermacentor albipictus]|uniref:amine sulfotransferase-like n=1 Tax=Dermacentor albipictus TaxID=60249 RepID=UPI0031FD1F19
MRDPVEGFAEIEEYNINLAGFIRDCSSNNFAGGSPVAMDPEDYKSIKSVPMQSVFPKENVLSAMQSTEDVSFGSFLECFHYGKTPYGEYFGHLLPWYEMRNEPNVLFFTYEQLKMNTRELVLKIADFLGEEHGTALSEDTEFYEKILQSSSLKNMKAIFDYTPSERIKALGELPPERNLKSLEFFKKLNIQKKMYKGSALVRKGMIGDWRDHYTTDYIAKTKACIAEKTKESDVMNLWKDLDLP